MNGRLAFAAGLTLLAILAIGLLPTILREQTRDWIAYEQAADRLTTGEPLYVFELANPDKEYYLYPPPTAAIWAAVGSPEGLLAIKVLALVGGRGADGRPDALLRTVGPLARQRGLAAAAVLAPSDLHDLVLGNVMALYVGAVAISVARPGWLGSACSGRSAPSRSSPRSGRTCCGSRSAGRGTSSGRWRSGSPCRPPSPSSSGPGGTSSTSRPCPG